MKINKKFWLSIVLALVLYGVVQILLTTGALNDVYKSMFLLICVNVMLAVSLNLINGITGQFSIGHAGFMSVGAYVSAILTLDYDVPFILTILIGGLVAAVCGVLIGMPTLRLNGDYLAIATLGFGEIIRIIMLNTEYVGGASGLSGIPAKTTWTIMFFFTLITVVLINNFIRSTHGRACIAIRENEIAAEAMGINTTLYKIIAFTLGALFAGMAGGLSAHTFYVITPGSFNFLKSFEILVMVVLGGLGSTAGSIVGAVFVTLLYTYLRDFPEWRMIIYSIVLILMMIFRPGGLLGSTRFSLKKFGKKEAKANGGISDSSAS
ncbi:branched-chain amino acid ABC transporter permease [Paenibacillus sp. 7124]|uniref:Branched-chain amino acid ABC transporter permease n=1 Tax=Paenibacillus apii TaxID=1850370 RepID=A0A6M1PHG6_9BACL|nr:branched-chain amino acid ABC transporter permease [Paenibacillus apii]NGM82676.1 branched-chain amino acid ABC transporter permease [Paenibacillus apii]NJJ39816.1 branched-chain amino acid ABC transporter permease [Paenibacillus apii]